ncbi:ABC-2 type transport system ATP-binding protein [Natranaerovirga hydrolytica]|uniref:ABC-2 type transport system ATP-binding protein n=1 Tax=Natranaerovirga hydrolytica TaxID=680378 RepID=A0A4V2Q1R1_9FIRM|nr:ABC transporter ATP-binding protein [Natranaerovirga hydrolytica]TCK98611.1 ABC-2 type transport system ATP-binding protein [Natranaerovirga hydrolytica]
MLKVEGLIKDYGKVRAVNDITFTAKPGEIYGFLGHNGAGKSTTIKVSSGLLKPTQGQVSICGYDIVKEPIEAKKNLGYVPETPFLYDKLTGAEFLELIYGVYQPETTAIERQNRVKEMLEEIELVEKGQDLIGSYSQGMRRKIALCSGFIHNPKVVLLDEPTIGLDASSAKVAKDLFRKHADEGNTLLLTTHIMEIAEKLCDRIGIISQGKIIIEGTIEALKESAKGHNCESLEDLFLYFTQKDQETNGGDSE